MAVESLFHYTQRETPLHTHHPLCKIIEMGLMAVAVGQTSLYGRIALMLLLLLLFALAKENIFAVLRQLSRFLFLILLVAGAAFFSAEDAGGIPVINGVSTAIQFSDYILTGMLFTTVTRSSDVSTAVYMLMRPLPRLKGEYLAAFIRIVLALVPVIFETLADVKSAAGARLLRKNRNPLKRIRYLSYGIVINSFLHASAFADALESRAYTVHAVRPVHVPRVYDVAASVVFISALIICAGIDKWCIQIV